MSKYNSNLERVSRQIHKTFCAKSKMDKEEVAFVVFDTGQRFLKFGTIKLLNAFELLSADLIELYEVEIGDDDYLVVELKANFAAACKTYKRPAMAITLQDYDDFYDAPCGFHDIDNPEREIDPDDFRGEGVYLMSEEKLRHELKTRAYKWILYRTPYRPGRFAESVGKTPPPRIE